MGAFSRRRYALRTRRSRLGVRITNAWAEYVSSGGSAHAFRQYLALVRKQ